MKTQQEIQAIVNRSTRNDIESQPLGRYSWSQEQNDAIGAARSRSRSMWALLDLAEAHQDNPNVVRAVMATAGGKDYFDDSDVIKSAFVARYKKFFDGDDDVPEYFECELYV